MAIVPLGAGESGDLFAEAVSSKVVGISDQADRDRAQAFAAFPMCHIPGNSGTFTIETAVDQGSVSTDYTARGIKARLVDIPDLTTLQVKVGDDRIAFAMDRREYFNYLSAIDAAGQLTTPAITYAHEIARRLGIIHREALARNHLRLNSRINFTNNWHSSSTTLGNPWSNSATAAYSLLRDAFRVTHGDTVLMSQDNYDALIDSPDLKKRFYGQGESDRVFTRSLLTEALSEIAGRPVKLFVDSFTGNSETGTDYLLGDLLLVFRGSANDGAPVISNGLGGVERMNAAACQVSRMPGSPEQMNTRSGFSLDNIGGDSVTDEQRASMFGFEYIVNDTQFVAENQVWHQLHSSFGFKILKQNGGVLFKAGAGR